MKLFVDFASDDDTNEIWSLLSYNIPIPIAWGAA